jgi:hypothetical protein
VRPFRALEPLARRPPFDRAPGARCELCTAPLADTHPHVVDLEARSLCCACPPCAVLFREPAAGGGRFRTVPDRVLALPDLRLDEARWSALEVPVGLAFFFFSSAVDRWVACYPSPAGPTEADVPDGALSRLPVRPLVDALEPDVEALLVHRHRNGRTDCLLVPIDACYELVGLVRQHWEGFDGGDAARAAVDGFLDRMRARARPVGGDS